MKYSRANVHRAALPAIWLGTLILSTMAAHAAEPEHSPMQRVSGLFDVKMTPESDTTAETGSARMRLDKRYHGALDATAVGTMLGSTTAVQGSAGYVAIERVTGTLDGRRGSFVLQHFGFMQGEHRHLDLRVVPDSADGELTGLQGTMQIRIEAGGAHYYDLEYRLGGE
jgi:hypothetical protein